MKLPPANSRVLAFLPLVPILALIVFTATKVPVQDAVPIPLDPNSFAPEAVPEEDRLPICYLTKMKRNTPIRLLLMVKEDNGVICLEVSGGKKGWYKASALEGVEEK